MAIVIMTAKIRKRPCGNRDFFVLFIIILYTLGSGFDAECLELNYVLKCHVICMHQEDLFRMSYLKTVTEIKTSLVYLKCFD